MQYYHNLYIILPPYRYNIIVLSSKSFFWGLYIFFNNSATYLRFFLHNYAISFNLLAKLYIYIMRRQFCQDGNITRIVTNGEHCAQQRRKCLTSILTNNYWFGYLHTETILYFLCGHYLMLHTNKQCISK